MCEEQETHGKSIWESVRDFVKELVFEAKVDMTDEKNNYLKVSKAKRKQIDVTPTDEN